MHQASSSKQGNRGGPSPKLRSRGACYLGFLCGLLYLNRFEAHGESIRMMYRISRKGLRQLFRHGLFFVKGCRPHFLLLVVLKSHRTCWTRVYIKLLSCPNNQLRGLLKKGEDITAWRRRLFHSCKHHAVCVAPWAYQTLKTATVA